MPEAFLVGGKRTVLGRAGGKLRFMTPENLAAEVLKALTAEYPACLPSLQDVILGNAVGQGGNIARLALLTAGMPVGLPGLTVDRQCGSGQEAINLAAHMIRAGSGTAYLAGGTESISREPWKLERPMSNLGDPPRFIKRPLFSPVEIGDPDMGEAAENVARLCSITREEQDAWALRSHLLACKALEEGRWDAITVLPPGIGPGDEGPRPNLRFELLKRMPPAFIEDGTVTAGNSCINSDGAAAVLLLSEQNVTRMGLVPMARFVASGVAGVHPDVLGLGPVPAVRLALEKAGLDLRQIGLIELNEAFAAQVLACVKEIDLDPETLNVNGGAIAFGHPYGATGAILTLHLILEMRRRGVKYGMVTAGIGGGLGIATIWENCF